MLKAEKADKIFAAKKARKAKKEDLKIVYHKETKNSQKGRSRELDFLNIPSLPLFVIFVFFAAKNVFVFFVSSVFLCG